MNMKRAMLILAGFVFALSVFSCKNSIDDDRQTTAETVSILINGADPESVIPLKYGQAYILSLSNNSSATWTTSDQSVAALSSSSGGSVTLTARSAGYAVIKATANGTPYSCPLLIADKKDDSDYNEQYNVVFTNFSAYKVIVCRDGLNNEIATLEAGAKKSLYVAPGSNEIIFYFRYSYCVIEDSDSGAVWLDVADSTAYTYPVDSSDVASGTVWITIPAPKNPKFNAAFLKVSNKSASPISLYKENTQQKLYNSEKLYIQPEHSGVYSIPASAQGASFEGWSLGDSPASAIPIAPFNAEYGVVYHCDFSSGFPSLPVTEGLRLAELQAEKTFTIMFESNGGTLCPPMETLVLEKLQMPVPERQGYDFAGWFTDSGLENPVAYPYTVTADITLYAKWTERIKYAEYTVKHFQQDTDRTSYTLKDTEQLSGAIGATTNAGKKQYPGFNAKPFEQQTISADGTTVVSIYYDRNAYTVAFKANGGTGSMQEQIFYYGIAQNLSRNTFIYSSYTFDGWATSATGASTYSDETEFSIAGQNPSNVTLYATWFFGIVVTAQTAGSIDLTDIAGEYIIKVTGNISQSTLQTLANKMKVSKNASFTLDLSEATGLTAIGATSDDKSIFADCPLRSVVLPETLETIGSYAFYNCSITSVTIPASVMTIGHHAFYYTSLESVEIDGAETVDSSAFASCKALKDVVLRNITTLGDDAFENCTSLSSVTMESVGSVGSYAFWNCTSLSSVTMESVSSIRYYAFYNCKSLLSVTMESVGSIYSQTFAGCTSLESVTMKSVGSIDSLAFTGCTSLESVTMKSVGSIGSSAFYNCTNLSSVTMKSVGSIGSSAFSDCTSLVSITVDAESIDTGAFSGCTVLTSVVIGKNVKSLDNSGNGCFYDCKNLISVRFEDTANWYYKYYSYSSSYAPINVTNAATNANNLTSYWRGLWYKE